MTAISISRLQTFYGHLPPIDLLRAMIQEEFKGKIAAVSSFGAGSALLLSLIAEVDATTPIVFLDTKKHFPETLEYLEELRKLLRLENIHIVEPNHELQRASCLRTGCFEAKITLYVL